MMIHNNTLTQLSVLTSEGTCTGSDWEGRLRGSEPSAASLAPPERSSGCATSDWPVGSRSRHGDPRSVGQAGPGSRLELSLGGHRGCCRT